MRDKANWLMLLGFIFLAGAFILPYLFPEDKVKFISDTAGPFLSVASFLILVAAMLMQKKELSLQRKELEFQREELTSTREVFKEQHKTQEYQRFENTFFHMIDLHNEIVNSIILPDEEINIDSSGIRKLRLEYRGRSYFEKAYENLAKAYGSNKVGNDDLARIKLSYNAFYINHQVFIGHYFRNLYRILKFIDSSDIEDKTNYIGIIRAQLSSNELCLLLYNSLSDYGFKKLFPLVCKYKLLKNMNYDLLLEDQHKNYYLNSI